MQHKMFLRIVSASLLALSLALAIPKIFNSAPSSTRISSTSPSSSVDVAIPPLIRRIVPNGRITQLAHHAFHSETRYQATIRKGSSSTHLNILLSRGISSQVFDAAQPFAIVSQRRATRQRYDTTIWRARGHHWTQTTIQSLPTGTPRWINADMEHDHVVSEVFFQGSSGIEVINTSPGGNLLKIRPTFSRESRIHAHNLSHVITQASAGAVHTVGGGSVTNIHGSHLDGIPVFKITVSQHGRAQRVTLTKNSLDVLKVTH